LGREETACCLHGGARFVVPLLQDYAWLALEPMRIELSRKTTASGKMIADPLPRVFSVAIGTTPELMQTAAIRLLGLAADEIKQQAEDIIVARLDLLIDAIDRGNVKPGTDEFHQRLESSISTELHKLGLVLINFRRE
jgi:flotillin